MRADFWQARRALHWSDPASASARSGGHYRRRSMTDRGGWVEVTADSGHGREHRPCAGRTSHPSARNDKAPGVLGATTLAEGASGTMVLADVGIV
jgi:hypothetical protein